MSLEPYDLSLPQRIIGVGILLLIFAGWLLFSRVMISLALDYPIRLAGQMPDYPAAGTWDYYLNCAYQSCTMLAGTVFTWGVPALLGFWLPRPLFPRLRGWRYWLVGASCVVLPVVAWFFRELYTLGG